MSNKIVNIKEIIRSAITHTFIGEENAAASKISEHDTYCLEILLSEAREVKPISVVSVMNAMLEKFEEHIKAERFSKKFFTKDYDGTPIK